jgi:hypothetical protein
VTERFVTGREAFELALHAARTSPESPAVPCPRCETPMEHLWGWERAAGDKEPPLCCPDCLTLYDEKLGTADHHAAL